MKKRIYAFDFDGTLTTRDTLIAFIRYAKGTRAFVLGFLLHAHLLVLMKLKLYPNWKAKQKIFSYFFKGMSLGDFDALCRHFAADNRQLLRPEGVRTLEQARAEGADIVIVSASIDNWVKPFFTNLDGLADNLPKITVHGTQIEIADRKLTGRFLTKNCYGPEKVNRILAQYPNRGKYSLIAFGDSRGDKELLAFADEAHYKPFR
jgi:HAD superfamily phosphoserine phosphatase-like hydrolase